MIPVKNPSELEGLFMKATYDENGRVVVETNARGILFFKMAHDAYCAACSKVGVHASHAASLAPDMKIAFQETVKEVVVNEHNN